MVMHCSFYGSNITTRLDTLSILTFRELSLYTDVGWETVDNHHIPTF